MDFEADIRLVVRVRFVADGDTEEGRVLAAKHVEDAIALVLTKAVAQHGEVISIVIEEVRES